MELYHNFGITVNGQYHEVDARTLSPSTTLNGFLREHLHLTGTKRMCLEGGCGTCVVSVKRHNNNKGEDEVVAVNSCLVSIFSTSGWEVYTIEGLGDSKSPSILQKAITKFHGTQCGYCTPGMIMNMFALKKSKDNLTMAEVENSFGGNICRCTGYRPILDAFKSICYDASQDLIKKCQDIEDLPLCPYKLTNSDVVQSRINSSFYYKLDGLSWIKVTAIHDLLEIIKTFNSEMNQNANSYTLVAGNTARGVYKADIKYKVYVDIQDVPELKSHKLIKTGLLIGANLTLTDAITLFSDISQKRPLLSYLKKLVEHLDLIANVPVRNIGTFAGNLMIKHKYNEFPSDIFLVLEAVNATLHIVDLLGQEVLVKPSDFLKINMENKIIKKIHLPFLSTAYRFDSFKIMNRAQNTHASINTAFLLKLFNDNIIEDANIVIGGLYPKIHATETERYITGKNIFKNDVLQQTFKILDQELVPEYDLMHPTPEFLKKCTISLFYKFILSIAPHELISPNNYSGKFKLQRPVSKGTQIYESVKEMYPLSYPIAKKEALNQTTGEAEYISDIPDIPGQLHAAFVLANVKPLSKIVKIHPERALEMEGVIAFFDKNDIPGRNNFTPTKLFIFANPPVEEELFCSGIVQYHSQPIGVVVAVSQEIAEKAADLIQVDYQSGLGKPEYHTKDILATSKNDRIKQDIIMEPTTKGNDVAHVIKGTWDMGWQAHFYMETQCCSAVYKEDGLDIWASTQWMDLTQAAAATVLDIPSSMITVHVKRLGGAFGGKIVRGCILSTATALAAYKLKKPVKMWLPMEKNFAIIGKRSPITSNYEIAIDKKGTVQYLNNTFYANHGQGGNEDLLTFTMELYNSTYKTDTFYTNSSVVDTDMHSSGYVRCPGTVEGMGMINSIMEHVALATNLDPLELKIKNLTDKDPKVLEYLNDLIEWADVTQRKKEIEEFNKNNLWRKKGICVVPMKYGMALWFNYGALVSIYHADGSVTISHGGVEAGQGINTKAIQTCAYKLGIPIEKITVKPSDNVIGANSAMTGASITSEGVCWGVAEACNILLGRMQPIREKMDNPTWEDLVNQCQKDMINLVANAMYSSHAPELGAYHVYAAAATEIELDVLTGQKQITRVDILEDVGDSMNPDIDIGQAEGAFIMGLGYYCTENVVVGKNGNIMTNRTWNYTPPGAKDIPVDFRIKFPGKNPNPVGVLKSKAVGEPPFCLSVSVPLAIRNAVSSVRKHFDDSSSPWYPIDGPSNVENTFVNCLHNYEKYVL